MAAAITTTISMAGLPQHCRPNRISKEHYQKLEDEEAEKKTVPSSLAGEYVVNRLGIMIPHNDVKSIVHSVYNIHLLPSQ